MIRVRDFLLPGMPSTPRGTNGPFRLIAGHTTEGNAGVAGAEATARWMASTASTRNASYHELWAWDGVDLHVLRLVAPNRAAHSIGPGLTYEPDAWVRESLGDKAGDPNMWVYAVAIAGRAAVEGVAYANDPDFLSHARERLNALGPPRLAEHFRFNPRTRTDWGRLLSPALGGLTLPYGEPPVFTRPVREKWRVPAGTAFWTGGPELGEQKAFTSAIDLWSNGETLDGVWRRLEYHDTASAGEDLYVRRSALTPISGTRNPTSGYGDPVMTTGYTQAELDTAKAVARAAGFTAGKSDMHAKAIVEAEEHLAEVRALK